MPKYSKKIQELPPKKIKNFQNIQELPKNSQDFENIQFLTSHLEAEKPFWAFFSKESNIWTGLSPLESMNCLQVLKILRSI